MHHPSKDRPRWVEELAEAAFPLAVLVYAIAFFNSVRDLSRDSRLYPQMLIGLLVILLVLRLGSVAARTARADRGSGTVSTLRDWAGEWAPTAAVAALTFAFAAGIPLIGFYTALLPYLVLTLLVLRVRRPLALVVYPLCFATASYLVFTRLLAVPLPDLFLRS